MTTLIQREGVRYGSLTVLQRAPKKSHNSYWHVQCDCGNEKVVAAPNLHNGATTTCGDRSKHPTAKRGDGASYTANHTRVRNAYGSASQFECINCDSLAKDWSHTHGTDPGDPHNYTPRCRPCHREYDHGRNV